MEAVELCMCLVLHCFEVGGNSPSTICQQIMVPSLQLMRATHSSEDFLSGLQAQMIGVVETETTARLF